MTVHMVRLFLEPPRGNADSAVDNWVQNHNEWTEDPTDHSLSVIEVENGTNFVLGNYRFIQDSTVTDLLDDMESRLDSIQGGLWYRIGYHACDHDEDEPTPCSWDKLRENGNIPSSVPTLEVT
jgi:hypothetical protein